MSKPIKLIVTDKGDPSVGINAQDWEVEFPLYIACMAPISDDDKEMLEDFREDIVNVYRNYCDGRCVAEYDFEMKYRDN